jgi:hypothetical protein
MGKDLDPLILDLLEWIAREPRSYADVLDAWRTSCPRLTVWEDCIDRGYATREHHAGREVMVALTQEGRDFLGAHGRTERALQASEVAATATARPDTVTT